MKLSRYSTFIFGLYLSLIFLWFSASLFATGNSHISIVTLFSGFQQSTQYGYIFGLLYGFIPLFGGLLGLRIAKKWGLFKSSMGKGVFFLSISLLFWALGSFTWSYYNFILHTSVPYPGLSDVGWVLCYPFWAIGIIYLGQASGAKFGLRQLGGKIFLIAIPIAVFAFSYYFMVLVARGGSLTSGGGLLKIFFDIAYPTGDMIILTIAFLIYGLSFDYLGGRYKWPIILILFGFLIEYVADFGFAYTTTISTYFNGGWVDLLYATSLFVLSFGLTNLDVAD